MGEHLSTCGRLIVLVVVWLLEARGAEAAPPAPPPPDAEDGSDVTLVFDMSMLGAQDAERLQPQIAEQLGLVLEQGELRVIDEPEVGEHTLRISVVAFDEQRRNYEVDLTLSSLGGVASMVTVRCDACTERRLVGMLAEELSQLVDMHAENLWGEGSGFKLMPECEPASEAQTRPKGPVPLIGPIGTTGATMLGVGVLALAAGGYLLGRQPDANADHRGENTTYLPAAVPALAAGAVVAGVGATLLGLDLERHRKRYFAIQMTPTYVGIQINQRF